MTRAFFLKDLRLASRTGAPLPGLGSLLALQGAVCLGFSAYTILIGPIPPEVWRGAASLLTTLAFVLAFIGPATHAALAASAEGNPDIAESLSTAPLGPTHFLLGKAALPAVQGVALQAALLPAWAFLTANGMLSMADVVRVVGVMLIAIPVCALSGAARFGGLGAPRMAVLLKAAKRRGLTTPISAAPAQQTWIALLGMAWVVQVMRGVSVGFPGASSPAAAALQDLVRPVIPIVGLDRGAFVPIFGLPVPVIVLSFLLFGAYGVSRVASSVAASPRASDVERDRSWRALIAARTVIVFHLAGAAWAISPAASAATAGCAALWYALLGSPVLEGRLRIAAASLVPCMLPALLTTAAAGIAGAACWVGIAAICAAVSAALPPPRLEKDRRGTAVLFVVISGLVAPLLAVAVLAPGSPLGAFASVEPVLAAWSWVSPPAAVLSLASTLLGPLWAWTFLEGLAPSLNAVPPWLAAPALFGLIALIALARSSLQKRRTVPQVG